MYRPFLCRGFAPPQEWCLRSFTSTHTLEAGYAGRVYRPSPGVGGYALSQSLTPRRMLRSVGAIAPPCLGGIDPFVWTVIHPRRVRPRRPWLQSALHFIRGGTEIPGLMHPRRPHRPVLLIMAQSPLPPSRLPAQGACPRLLS